MAARSVDLSPTAVAAFTAVLNGEPDAAVSLVAALPMGERIALRKAAAVLAEALSNVNRCPVDDKYVAVDDPQFATIGHPAHPQRAHRSCVAVMRAAEQNAGAA